MQIEGAVASKERQEILKRTQDGLLRAIKAGKYSGGIVAYGYRLNHDIKELEIEPTEADVVKLMFQWCVEERLSTIKIAERLNAMGIPTHYKKDGRSIQHRGKRAPEKTTGLWRGGRVGNMLRNPAYMGNWEWGKRSEKRKPSDTIPGYCPAIVSEETFVKAAEVLKQNRLFAPRNSRRQYLLRGLIKCGFCGKTFCGSYSRGRPNKSKGTTYYKCTMKSRWKDMGVPKCPSPILRGDEIETVVWEDIKNFCKSPETVLAQLKAQQKPADEGMEERINQVSAQIIELKRQEANLIRIAAASQEVDAQILDEQLLELHKGQEELVAYKAALESKILQSRTLEDDLNDIADRLAQLGDRIDQATFEEKRRAVEELVKRIEVESVEMNGKLIPSVTITYRFSEPIQEIPPLPTSVIVNHTGVLAAITATPKNPVPATIPL